MKPLVFMMADFADFTRGMITLSLAAQRAQAKFDAWMKTLPIRVHDTQGALIEPPRDLADYEMRVERVYIRRSDE